MSHQWDKNTITTLKTRYDFPAKAPDTYDKLSFWYLLKTAGSTNPGKFSWCYWSDNTRKYADGWDGEGISDDSGDWVHEVHTLMVDTYLHHIDFSFNTCNSSPNDTVDEGVYLDNIIISRYTCINPISIQYIELPEHYYDQVLWFDTTRTTSTNEIRYYHWDFGDNSNRITTTNEEVSHTYSRGTYDVEVTMEDSRGNTATVEFTITIHSPIPTDPPHNTPGPGTPTPNPTPLPGSGTYELQAEYETWSSGGVESDHSGYTGTGYVNTDNALGEWIEWSVELADACNATCVLRYACASDRPMDLSVNGSVVSNLGFPASGEWTTWATETADVILAAGSNTIRLTATDSGGAPNMDKMDLTIDEGEDPTPTPIILGDVNGDGEVDIIDALLIAHCYIGLTDCPSPEIGDVNCDGNIDIVDSLLIARYYVGLISWLPGCEDEYSGYVVVRLSADLPQPDEYADTLEKEAGILDLNELLDVIRDFGLTETRRMILSLTPMQILDLENKAINSEFRPLNSLTKYWKIDMRKQRNNIDAVIERLSSIECVDLAYKQYNVSLPAVDPTNDPHNSLQSYLDPAPVGIDARWAWTQPDTDGTGIGFVDIEFGWYLNHEDFTSKAPALIYGNMNALVGINIRDHGTAVLGVAIADDNNVGVVGVAPHTSSVNVISCYQAATDSYHVADAIIAALTVMTPGDVLLLEIQKNDKPVELDTGILDSIRLVVACGNIVIEAAGNGNDDLDYAYNSSWVMTLNRLSSNFIESGAIMVGAALSTPPHNRNGVSNYGSRIDCYAWGENIVSCGYGDLAGTTVNNSYTATFSNTSGASAIIAGAALLIQSRYEADFGFRLSPLQMRDLLSDPATGTPQGGGVTGDIGVMPDLQAILETTYDEKPDVFIRDHVGDSGAVPSTGSKIYASPDIITLPATVADPQGSFGTGSGTENSNILGNIVDSANDNYIYVRMRNRGGTAANNVTSDIYYSHPTTLVTPGTWNFIGTTLPLDVPATGDLYVTQALTWPSASIPATGHYCYVGILHHVDDPAPPKPDATDLAGFESLIRDNNNIAWRNFNIVEPPVKGPAEEPFFIAGAPDIPRVFDLEILQKIHPRAEVWFETELNLGEKLLKNHDLEYEIDIANNLIRFYISNQSPLYFGQIVLDEAALYKSQFIVRGSENIDMQGDWIAIRQLFNGDELGRITWQFEFQKEFEEQLQ